VIKITAIAIAIILCSAVLHAMLMGTKRLTEANSKQRLIAASVMMIGAIALAIG
jgi:hypothetical protein